MKRRLLAMALSLVMLVGLFPTAAMATDDPGGGNSSSVSADTSTLTTWEAVFGGDTLSTKDIGRIWTDKTVSEENITLSGDIGSSVTIDKETSADFLVGLSALGSAADITDVTKVPTDTVFVLDLSNNMWEDDQINTMIQAANEALKTLLNANPQNRVAVVGYSTQSSVLLPLEHYESSSTFLTRDNNTLKATAVVRGEIKESSFERLTNTSHKYTQHGIYTGMQLLQSEEETTATVGGTTVTRAPVMVLMAEGEAKYGSEKFIDPPEEATIEEVGQRATSRYAQSFVAAMTAAYMKEQVTAHYYGDSGQSARVYTIGVDVDECDAPALAYAYLDPAQTVPSHFSATDGDKKDPTASWALNYFKEKFNDYNTGGTAAIHTGSYYGGNLGWKETKITKNDNENVTVSKFEYNDQYYDVTDANWGTIFDQIADDVSNQAPTAPTDVTEGAEGTGGESGKLVFTDQLGKYMKVTGTPTIVFAGKKYAAKGSPETKDNVTTYTFEGTVEGNPVYGSASLSAIKLTVTNGDEGQTLVWEIPANLLPLRTVKVQGDTDEQGETSYTINLDKNAYPIRLFYSVAKEDEHNWSEADNDYLKSRSKNGQTNYYEAVWDQENGEYGTTTAVFTPAESNAFYHYTEDTILYNLVNTGNQDIYLSEEDAEAAEVTTILPGAGTVQVGGIAYRLEAAEGYVSGRAYYYQHVYYQAEDSSDTAAQKRTDYHMLQDGSRIVVGGNDSNADIDNGVLKIKAGTNKLSRVSDGDGVKVKNTTQTAGTYRHPVFELGENEKVTVYLGNNGLLKEATPTGSLTVTVGTTEGDGANSDQEFIYKLILANLNGYDTLTGEYTIKIGGESSGQKIGNNGTFKLKAGQCATIEGLPAGSVWQLQQENVPGYTPAFTGDVYQEGAQSGAILYKEKAGAATLDKNVTVTNTYNPAQVSYLLTYDGNAISGSLQAPPPQAQSVNSGASVTLPSSAPTHQDVDGKAVALIGWTETATSKIYSLADKSEFESLGEDFHEKGGNYTMPAKLTTLYAVWGYDTDEDGTADVKETTYTLTYNANGGKFTEEKETKEVTVVAQDGYKLLASGEEGLPTHAKTNWNGTETAVVFMGWSTTKLEKIYSVNDERPVTVSEIDITESETVYAVWGYSSDGTTPDVEKDTVTVTASVNGDNGSISPENKTVIKGSSVEFTITANEDYALDTIKVGSDIVLTNDGDSEYTADENRQGKWTLKNVQAGTQVVVSFAEDKDRDGIPDKNKPIEPDPQPESYALTYDTNGGFGGPGKVEVKADAAEDYTLETTNVPKHAPDEDNGTAMIFIGWTTERDTKIYSASDEKGPTTVETLTLTADDEVYAVWGYDANEDGTPDVEETDKYSLTYDTNAMEGDTVSGSVSDANKYVSKQTVALADGSGLSYQESGAENAKVMFLGWSTTKTDRIFSSSDEDKTAFAEVTIVPAVTFDSQDIEVYAVWGYDKDKDDRPDVIGEDYVIYPFAGPNGSISPDTAATVEKNGDQAFAFAPNNGYAVDRIVIDDTTYLNNGKLELEGYDTAQKTYTFSNVQDDHSIIVTFSADKDGDGIPDKYDDPEAQTCTVTASVSGAGGSIAPSGTMKVNCGESKHFTITADSGYHIADVTVNGKSVGAVSGYTLQNITENTTIVASFARNSSGTTRYTITASAGAGGKISPSGSVRVSRNSDKTFTITANEGYVISDVLVDDKSVGAVEKYTFEKVREKHTIEAVFALASGVADPEDTGVSDWLNTKDHTAYLSGYANGSFGPNKNMTRAEAAQMFYNLLLNQEVSGAVSFTDVAADAWYAKAVHTLASLGILQGVGDGRFAPDRAITRAEFTVIAMRFADLDTSGENIFTDVNAGDWFYDQVVGSIRYGWINGYEDGTFRPNNTITRAEVTTIVNRMLGRAADKDYVDSHKDQLRQFPDVAQTNWAYYNIVEATNAHDYEKSGGTEDWTGLAD